MAGKRADIVCVANSGGSNMSDTDSLVWEDMTSLGFQLLSIYVLISGT